MNQKIIQFRPRVSTNRLSRHLDIFFRKTVFNSQFIKVQVNLVSFLDKINLGESIIDVHNVNEIEKYVNSIKEFYLNDILYKIEPLKYNKLEINYSDSSKEDHNTYISKI